MRPSFTIAWWVLVFTQHCNTSKISAFETKNGCRTGRRGASYAISSLHSDTIDQVALPNKANELGQIGTLLEKGCNLDLFTLETKLQEKRIYVENNQESLESYYHFARVLMMDCHALNSDPKKSVRLALEADYYQVLKCLCHFPIWKSTKQEHWFWARIYGTRAFEKSNWDRQNFEWYKFWQMIFKADNPELLKYVNSELPFRVLCKHLSQNAIFKYDAVKIFSLIEAEWMREIVLNAELMAKYQPPKIIGWIIINAGHLQLDTRHIDPSSVKSAEALQNLFDAGYTRIPKFCLRNKNGCLILQPDCTLWLVEHNCLLLLQKVFPENSNCRYHDIVEYAATKGSLDVLIWLTRTKKVNCSVELQMYRAIQSGRLNVVKWLAAEYKDSISWNAVIDDGYFFLSSQEIVKYLREQILAILSPLSTLILLIADGDFQGLMDQIKKSALEVPWDPLSTCAAIHGKMEILEWIYETSGALPNAYGVAWAASNGHLSVLPWVYDIVRVKPASKDNDIMDELYKDGSAVATECLLYAALQKDRTIMEWILENLLGGVLPVIGATKTKYEDLKLSSQNAQKAQLRLFKWMVERGDEEMGFEKMMLEAAALNNVLALQWLQNRGQAVTFAAVELAASRGQIEFLEAVHQTDPHLVCTMRVINKVAAMREIEKYALLDLIYRTCGMLPNRLEGEDEDLLEWVSDRKKEQKRACINK